MKTMMAASMKQCAFRTFNQISVDNFAIRGIPRTWCRLVSSVKQPNTLANDLLEKHRESKLGRKRGEITPPDVEPTAAVTDAPREYRHVFPDLLPNPDWWIRDKLTEKLEREDMFRRRAVMDIPEFYVGSILAVTVADPYAPGKQNRFVGTCIHRGGHGLRSSFVLRNVVEGEGVEIMYEMYNPLLQKIEVLKLEKRLDEELFYLRDAPQEYSYIPQNIEPVSLPKGSTIPLNTIKVKLNPRPWLERWERQDLKGVEDLELPERFYQRAREREQPWENFDLMKQYRTRINDTETAEIMSDVHQRQQKLKDSMKKKSIMSKSGRRK